VARLGALRRQTWEGWDEHVSTEHAEMVEHDSGHAFCETIAAALTHIRRLTTKGRAPGGGADTPALCGAAALWDTQLPFTRANVEGWDPWPQPLCSQCKATFLGGPST
jgi:hypothetical protein